MRRLSTKSGKDSHHIKNQEININSKGREQIQLLGLINIYFFGKLKNYSTWIYDQFLS